MDEPQDIQVYFDGSCPVCRAEIETLDQASRSQSITFIDCSQPTDQRPTDGAERPTQKQLLRAFHVFADDRWLVGPDAFARIYQAAGLQRMARLWGSKRLRPLVSLGYRIFLFCRPLLAAIGAARAVRWFLEREARRS